MDQDFLVETVVKNNDLVFTQFGGYDLAPEGNSQQATLYWGNTTNQRNLNDLSSTLNVTLI